MALTAPQVSDVWNRMRQLDQTLSQLFDKPSLAAAVSAADTWATANAASFNAALPDPFKTNASAAQKAILLAYVCMKRAGVI